MWLSQTISWLNDKVSIVRPKPKPRLLVVDDSKAIQRCIAAMTRHLTSEISFMSCGEEFRRYALADLDSEQYDIVILDNDMSGIDGIDALIQARAQNYQGRVIMFSANED